MGEGFYKFYMTLYEPAVAIVDSGDVDMTLGERFKVFRVEPNDTFLDDSISNVRADLSAISNTVDGVSSDVGDLISGVDSLTNTGVQSVI